MVQALRTSLRYGGLRQGGLQPGLGGDSIFATASLDLNFAVNKNLGTLVDATTGTTLVDHTRASSGTYVGSDGLIKTATTNYLLYSEEFDNASWVNSSTTEDPNAGIAPDGTTTADKLLFDSGVSGASCQILQDVSGLLASTTYVVSIYLKAGEASKARIGFVGRTAASGFIGQVLYDFTLSGAGTDSFVGTGGTAPTNHSAAIVAVGDGWYRCSITATTQPTAAIVRLLVAGDNVDTGTGTNGFFMWGAQLEQSSTVGEYIPTTSTINSAPRFDHDPTTGESLGLLVEEQRSNLLLNSGTLSTQDVTVTAVAHTLSFTGTGTITLSGASTAGPLVGTGTNEANRVSLTFTPTAGTLTLTVSGTVSNAQLEIGSFRSSYIPTSGSQGDRAADVVRITGSAFTSFYNQTEGTIYAEATPREFTNTDGIVSIDNNSGAERLQIRTSSNTGALNFIVVDNNSVQSNTGTSNYSVLNQTNKYSASYKLNSFASCLNAGSTTSGTGTVPTPTQLQIGFAEALLESYFNGPIGRICYWNQRLPNETLQQITT